MKMQLSLPALATILLAMSTQAAAQTAVEAKQDPKDDSKEFTVLDVAVITVSADPNILQLSPDLIGKGLARIFSPKGKIEFESLPNGSGSSQTGVLRLILRESDMGFGQKTSIDRLLVDYEHVLRNVTEKYRRRLDERWHQQDHLLRHLQDETSKLQIEMEYVRHELETLEGNEQQFQLLKNKKREMELEITGLSARRKVLEDKIAVAAKAAEALISTNATIQELQNARRNLQAKIEETKKLIEKDPVRAAQLDKENQKRLLEIEATEERTRASQFAMLDRQAEPLNQQLAKALADLADYMARNQFIAETLAHLEKDHTASKRKLVLERVRLEMLIARAQRNFDSALANLDEIDQRRNGVKDPSVMVVTYLNVVPAKESVKPDNKRKSKEGALPASKDR